MNQRRRVRQRLHKVGLDGVFQQHGDGAGHAQVRHGDRLAVVGVADNNFRDAALQIAQTVRQTKNRHQFAGHGDVKLGFPRTPDVVPPSPMVT